MRVAGRVVLGAVAVLVVVGSAGCGSSRRPPVGGSACPTAAATPSAGAVPRAATAAPSTWLLPVSACDVWSIAGRSGTRRWDGTGWRPFTLPFTTTDIDAEVAAGPADVWFTTGYAATLTFWHWDGQRWSNQPVPAPSFDPGVAPARMPGSTVGGAWLAAMTASGPDDVWAVGGTATRDGRKPVTAGLTGYGPPLIEHWDGTRWQQVPPPASWQPGNTGDHYRAVAVQSGGAGDVWLAGDHDQDGSFPQAATRLARWDGRTWHDEPAPPQVPTDGSLTLVVDAANDVWTSPARGNAVEHFDGTAWRSLPLPAGLAVRDVAADGAGGVWVTTRTTTTADPNGEHAPTGGLLHRTATTDWRLVATPAPPHGWLAHHPPRGGSTTPWQDQLDVELEARLPTSNAVWFRVSRSLLPRDFDPNLLGAEDSTDPTNGGTLDYTLTF